MRRTGVGVGADDGDGDTTDTAAGDGESATTTTLFSGTATDFIAGGLGSSRANRLDTANVRCTVTDGPVSVEKDPPRPR